MFGWVAALAFGEAANNTAKTQGVNGLTRANLLKSLSDLTKFDAGGMFGTTNVGQRIPTPCFLMEQFTNDTFKRLYPTKAGTFDCKASNNVKVKDDLIG